MIGWIDGCRDTFLHQHLPKYKEENAVASHLRSVNCLAKHWKNSSDVATHFWKRGHCCGTIFIERHNVMLLIFSKTKRIRKGILVTESRFCSSRLLLCCYICFSLCANKKQKIPSSWVLSATFYANALHDSSSQFPRTILSWKRYKYSLVLQLISHRWALTERNAVWLLLAQVKWKTLQKLILDLGWPPDTDPWPEFLAPSS